MTALLLHIALVWALNRFFGFETAVLVLFVLHGWTKDGAATIKDEKRRRYGG